MQIYQIFVRVFHDKQTIMDDANKLYNLGTPTHTIFDKTINYLNDKYIIRFNEISLEYEISLKDKSEWDILNLNSLYIELCQAEIKISIKNLETLIRSHLIDKYNPIKEYFTTLEKWDGEDHIKNLASYLKTDDDQVFTCQFEKWLTRVVLCVLKKNFVNKQCLVFTNTLQNSGKTTFFRFLIPPVLERYYTENISVDKDGQIALCKNFIANADELAILSKSDVNALKSFISKSSVNIRLPYGRKAELMDRISSFAASTNRTNFLEDPTGSVRWLVFEVFNIDFKYSKDIDINKVWAQAYYNAFERKNYNSEMTPKDIEVNEKRNERFTQLTKEQETLAVYYKESDDLDYFKTATEISNDIQVNFGIRANTIQLGRALGGMKYKRIKHPKKKVYGYLIDYK